MLDRSTLSAVRSVAVDWDALFCEAEVPKQKARIFFSTFWKEWVLEPQSTDHQGAILIVITPPALAAGEYEVRLAKGRWTFFGVEKAASQQIEIPLR
jgi:hypothetical protein